LPAIPTKSLSVGDVNVPEFKASSAPNGMPSCFRVIFDRQPQGIEETAWHCASVGRRRRRGDHNLVVIGHRDAKASIAAAQSHRLRSWLQNPEEHMRSS
jgi:hypothetical protein